MKSILAISIVLILFGNNPNISYADSENVTKIYQIKCNDKNYNVIFNISNTTITDLNGTNNYVHFLIHNPTSGKLTAYVPVDIMTHYNGYVTMLLNGQDLSYSSINSTSLIKGSSLFNGNSELEIALIEMEGMKNPCSIVPEFGSTVITIVTVGIIGVILIQRRFWY